MSGSPEVNTGSAAWHRTQSSAVSPSTRVVALVRVRLKSFLCKYYFSRMSKFHSSFSLDFILAKFLEHISFCKQSRQEGVTPNHTARVTDSGSSSLQPPAAAAEGLCGVGRRASERGGLRMRGRGWPTALAETAPPPPWSSALSLAERHSVFTYSLTGQRVLGAVLSALRGPCLQGLTAS